MIATNDDRHGTNPGYNLGCRDHCCRHAHMVWMKRYRLYGTTTVPALGFDRRVEALRALGYDGTTLSKHLGKSKSYIDATYGQERVHKTTHDAMAELYERLCMTVPTGWVAERTRRRAVEEGYAPPLAYDDIDRDEQPFGVDRKVA